MSSRVRLTARGRSAADQTPYPGNVNQPDRKDPAWDQYHTFEQRVNHELPDMRHEWQNDSRDDIGFGVPEAWGKQPTVAAIRVAANKAIRVAILLLGDKVGDECIEAQARDLMAMGPKAMDRTMQRFAETQAAYEAAEDKADEKKDEEKKAADDKVEDKKEDKAEEKKAATESEFKPKIEKPGSEEQPKVAAEDKKDEKVEDKKAADAKVEDAKKDEEKKAADLRAMVVAAVSEAMKAALPDFIQKKVDEKKEDKKDDAKESKKSADESADKKDDKKSCAAAESDKKDDAKADEKKAADATDKKDDAKVEDKKAADESEKKDDEAADKKASAPKVGMNEFDIELTGAMEDEVAPDAEADERLASLFDNDGLAATAAAGNSTRKVEASQKSGIKKLGGQPRVASADGGGVDISSIWQTAPDVSEAFK